MKRIIAFALALVMACGLCGCGKKQDAEPAATPAAASDQSKFTWQIEVRESKIAESLHTDAGVPQYDGGIMDVAYDNAPADGNSFVILTLTIRKGAAGGGSFDWKKLSLKDASGNSYARMENDSFLSNHSYKRMPGTALQIGENKGSICFEIPAEAAKGSLTLVYDAGDQGLNTLPVQ